MPSVDERPEKERQRERCWRLRNASSQPVFHAASSLKPEQPTSPATRWAALMILVGILPRSASHKRFFSHGFSHSSAFLSILDDFRPENLLTWQAEREQERQKDHPKNAEDGEPHRLTCSAGSYIRQRLPH